MFNVARYLETCLQSVFVQDLDTNDFEIVLVDDGSTDDSLQVARNLTAKHSNVTILSQENKGLGGARNAGVDSAKGRYLIFLDPDDWYLPGTIEKLIIQAEKYELDILEFGAQGVKTDGDIVYSKSLSSFGKVETGLEYCKVFRYLDSACNKLYSADFLKLYNIKFLERIYIEDYEFNTRTFLSAKKVMATNLIAAQFLQSPSSITRNNDKVKWLKMQEDILSVIKIINSIRSKHKDDRNVSEFLEQRLGYLTATIFFQLIKRNQLNKKLKELRLLMIYDHIYFINYRILDPKKELFRRIFLQNFTLLTTFNFINRKIRII